MFGTVRVTCLVASDSIASCLGFGGEGTVLTVSRVSGHDLQDEMLVQLIMAVTLCSKAHIEMHLSGYNPLSTVKHPYEPQPQEDKTTRAATLTMVQCNCLDCTAQSSCGTYDPALLTFYTQKKER